jgi:hypothetical protein
MIAASRSECRRSDAKGALSAYDSGADHFVNYTCCRTRLIDVTRDLRHEPHETMIVSAAADRMFSTWDPGRSAT